MLADSSNAYVVDFKIYAGRAEGGISQYGLGMMWCENLCWTMRARGIILVFI